MAKGIKICRVCGKEYEACHTQRPNLDNEFRWQEVACSPECGSIYLQRIIASRSPVVNKNTEDTPQQPVKKKVSKKKVVIEDDLSG